MRKKTVLLVAMLALFVGSANAQWFDFSNNRRASIGVNLGVVGYDLTSQSVEKNLSGFGTGINLSISGLYLDFIYQSPQHRWDRHVTQAEYDDHTALAINVGYQIPVTSWLYVMPLIGYSNETTGKTLGNSIGIDVERRSIYHEYKRLTMENHFNYGVGLMFRPIEMLEIGAVASSHAIYGTISFSSNFKK
jgi:hypothetical protein